MVTMSQAHSESKSGAGPLARSKRLSLNRTSDIPNEIEQQILQAIEGIRFGSVSVVLQDGVVVQLESNERFRPVRKG
jgi:hypothetical protein